VGDISCLFSWFFSSFTYFWHHRLPLFILLITSPGIESNLPTYGNWSYPSLNAHLSLKHMLVVLCFPIYRSLFFGTMHRTAIQLWASDMGPRLLCGTLFHLECLQTLNICWWETGCESIEKQRDGGDDVKNRGFYC